MYSIIQGADLLKTRGDTTNVSDWFALTVAFILLFEVPIFSKREEMLLTLCEYTVPIQRAVWYIKMASFYHESKIAESKIKKRQQLDLSQGMFFCCYFPSNIRLPL